MKTNSITQCHDKVDNSQDKFYEKIKPFLIYSKIQLALSFGGVNENFDVIENLLNMMPMSSTTLFWGLIIFLEGGVFCFLFFVCFPTPCGWWDLGIPTGDWTLGLGSVSSESLPLDHQGSPVSLNNVNMKMAKLRTYVTDSAPKMVKAVRSLIYIEVQHFSRPWNLSQFLA